MAGRGPAEPRRPPSGRRPARRRTARSARGVHHDHVRMLDLGQVCTGSAGLTAGLTPSRGSAGRPAGLGRTLGQPVSRRRLGGVGGVGPQPGLQLNDVRVELADARLKGGDHRVPGDDLGPQPGDGGRSSRVRRTRRRIVRHTDADRVPALLVRRARPWQAETGTAASSGSNRPCGAGTNKGGRQCDIPYADAAQGRGPPSTSMGLLHTLHGSVLPSPVIVKLTTARGRSTTNQTARAAAATG